MSQQNKFYRILNDHEREDGRIVYQSCFLSTMGEERWRTE